MLGATLALVPILVIEAVSSNSSVWHTFAIGANWAIWVVFALELSLILRAAPRKLAALKAHWLDAALVVVSVPLFSQLLASLRLIRLTRLLRLFRVGVILSRAVGAERRLASKETFRFVALATTLLIAVAGVAEAHVDHRDFKNYWVGIWWAICTVSTVGYGDVAPKNAFGRVIAIPLIIAGIGFLSVLTAAIASRFVKIDTDEETDGIRDTLRRIEAELIDLKALIGDDRRPQAQLLADPVPVGAGRTRH
jgi:voltage-gated potassium channel